ncbi:MAG: hypothetical protein FWG75_09905 [Cystobacterineae bacterium]|nr:hypothetical protein [Cystobacterineae bacterium]
MEEKKYFIPERARLEALFRRGGVVASPQLLQRAAARVGWVAPAFVQWGAPRPVGLPLRFAERLAKAFSARALSIFDEEGLLLSEYPKGKGLPSKLPSMHCLWPLQWKSLVVEMASGEFLCWVAGGALGQVWRVGLLVQERLSARQVEHLRLKLSLLQEEQV